MEQGGEGLWLGLPLVSGPACCDPIFQAEFISRHLDCLQPLIPYWDLAFPVHSEGPRQLYPGEMGSGTWVLQAVRAALFKTIVWGAWWPRPRRILSYSCVALPWRVDSSPRCPAFWKLSLTLAVHLGGGCSLWFPF